MTDTQNTVVEFEKVYFGYDNNIVLEDISIKINKKDFIGVVGPNGCGKTTFLKIILGLLYPQKGFIKVFDTSPKHSRNKVGYVSQHLESDLTFPLNVMDVILMGRLGLTRFFGKFTKEDRESAFGALQRVEMADLSKRRFGSLSGGQRKRVLIARALVSNPQLLIMDEPAANVDIRIRQKLYELLKELNQNITIILSSHDLSFVTSYVNHVACLNRTLICHPTKDISGKMLEELYRGNIKMVEHMINCHPERNI